MSRRVFVASVATETNTFSPLRTDLEDFKESFYAAPGEHPDTPTLCSAVFPCARKMVQKSQWELVEGTATWAEPGGIVNVKSWHLLRDQLLDELRAAMPVDIVLLGLHGAMVSQDCDDCDGQLLENVREIVGPEVVVGATLDPHSHLSQRRVDNADLLVVFKEFPHTDFVLAADKLCELAERTALGEIKPQSSVFDCRMIEILPTNREPMRSFVDRISALENQDDVLAISIVHGFMAGDVPDLGTKVLVITDHQPNAGAELAQSLGLELFGFRGTTRPAFCSATQALDQAMEKNHQPVVIADVWDNPGGGVPGDSTKLLLEIIQRQISGVALATIWDPVAVRTCFSAGEGASLPLRFGAKMSAQSGQPIDADVLVRKLVRNAEQSFGESIVPLGDSVWIEIDGIHVILNSVRSQVFNPDLFTNMGIDPRAMRLLVVKSTNHFHDAFAPIAADILYAEIEGPYPSDPATNPYTKLRRAIWPRVLNPHAIEELEHAS